MNIWTPHYEQLLEWYRFMLLFNTVVFGGCLLIALAYGISCWQYTGPNRKR